MMRIIVHGGDMGAIDKFGNQKRVMIPSQARTTRNDGRVIGDFGDIIVIRNDRSIDLGGPSWGLETQKPSKKQS